MVRGPLPLVRGTGCSPGDREAREARLRLERAAAARSGPTLAGLFAELGTAPVHGTRSLGRISNPPTFSDDVLVSGLRFRFDNGATPSKQLPETMSGGVGLLDYDGDGWLDAYLIQGGPFPPRGTGSSLATDEQKVAANPDSGDRLFRNRGDGTFEDATAAAGIANLAQGYGHGVAVGDYDNDGHPDLFITRGALTPCIATRVMGLFRM